MDNLRDELENFIDDWHQAIQFQKKLGRNAEASGMFEVIIGLRSLLSRFPREEGLREQCAQVCDKNARMWRELIALGGAQSNWRGVAAHEDDARAIRALSIPSDSPRTNAEMVEMIAKSAHDWWEMLPASWEGDIESFRPLGVSIFAIVKGEKI
jgi:hypothetical protein